MKPRALTRWMCWLFIPVIGLSLAGCAKDLKQVKDPFFEKWSTMAETTRALWPFFGVAIALLLAVSYVPALTIRF